MPLGKRLYSPDFGWSPGANLGLPIPGLDGGVIQSEGVSELCWDVEPEPCSPVWKVLCVYMRPRVATVIF